MFLGVDISEWKTKNEIIDEITLNGGYINERSFRNMVKEKNKDFIDGLSEYFIAHSDKGYKITTDTDEIIKSIKDKEKRAFDMLVENARVRKRLNLRNNIQIQISDSGVMYLEG